MLRQAPEVPAQLQERPTVEEHELSSAGRAVAARTLPEAVRDLGRGRETPRRRVSGMNAREPVS
jgi:hypothetical protein